MKNKERKQRLDFSQKLAQKLSHLGKVEEDEFSDKSLRWITLRKGDMELVISFDIKGEKIDSIQLFKDKVEVVSQIQISKF